MALSFIAATGNSTINGNSPTIAISTTGQLANDLIIVAYALPRTGTSLAVRSSVAADNFTQVGATQDSTAGTARLGIFARTVTSTGSISNAICTGTGNSQDATVGLAFVVRDSAGGIIRVAPTPTSSTGSGTTPDSPSITVETSNCMVMSFFASPVNDTAVTGPTSYVNATSTAASDTRSLTIGGATITLASTAAENPGSWSNVLTGAWTAYTVALVPGSTSLRTWEPPQLPYNNWRQIKVVDY